MRALLIWLCLAVTVAAQTTVSTKMAITGLEGVEKIGDMLLIANESKPKFESVGLVEVKTEAANVIVNASDINRRKLPTTKLGPSTYAVLAQGRVWIRVVCIDFIKNIYTDEETEFTIGPPLPPTPPTPPDPPIPPTPDVPSDPFDNIGQRVATWTKGIASNPMIGAIYLRHAKNLRGADLNTTITEEGNKLKAELNAVPGYTTQYTAFITGVNADIQARWQTTPMGKGVLADYWTAIAAGLGVK